MGYETRGSSQCALPASHFVDREKEASLVGCSGCEAQILCEMCAAKAESIKSNDKTMYRVPLGYCDEVRTRYLSLIG